MSDDRKRRLWRRLGIAVPVALLCASLLTCASYALESFVSYVPAKIDANAMRTLYLEKILRFACLIAMLNVAAIVFVLAGREFGD
jgi:mannose/fructose/N-acetylgalactosamine-specific phosphotransferase system component IIC